MEEKKRIYCVEGVHDWGEGEEEPTIQPMMELLQSLNYWNFLHRTCATELELKYRLEKEWWNSCADGSILYFCTHGDRDQIYLCNDPQAVVGLTTLKEWIGKGGAKRCHIHFGGCDTFSGSEDNLKDLMDYTEATSVSGYAVDVGWLDGTEPAIALELLFFGQLWEVNLTRNDRSRSTKLRKIRDDIQSRFDECKFRMLVRKYKKS